MVYCLQILGASLDCPTRREVATFISESASLSEGAVFEPPLDGADASSPNWGRFSVSDGAGRELVIERHVGDQQFRDELGKLLFAVPKTRPGRGREWVLDTLRRARQLITLCLEAEGTTTEEWEMLDALEALLLKRCNGILFAPREGFYDANLRLKHRI